MNKLLLALTTLYMPLFLKAQVHENFSADTILNSTWFGDSSFFINATGQLQSKGTINSEIAIVTQNKLIKNVEWNCWIRNAFSPSTQNFSRFYLVSDSANLKGPLNGYFIQFGGITGNLDSITFWKQKGISKTLLIGGRSATFSKSNNVVRIKVIRDEMGNWQLWSDTSGGVKFVLEGLAIDNEIKETNYLGYYAKLTSGNANNFYLDDVYVGPVIHDTLPPTLDTVFVVSDSIIELKFSEEVDSVLSLNINNYFVDNGLGVPINCRKLNNDLSVILLQFSHQLSNKSNYNLAITNLVDLSGNEAIDIQYSFIFYQPQKYDLLISEFLPDPTPAIDLPEHEFIELYNNTGIPINILDWKLSDGSTNAIFPAIIIAPNEYIIVCDKSYQTEFIKFGKTIGLDAFPSLNNAGDLIQIIDGNNQIIHQIQYNYSWYSDVSKSGGGWSIELINPKSICKDKYDYAVSIDSSGGTPGKINAVWDLRMDKSAPQLINTTSIDSILFYCLFNEPLDSLMARNAEIQIKKQTQIFSSNIQKVNSDSIWIVHQPFFPNSKYQFSLNGLSDCLKNRNDSIHGDVYFYAPEPANFADIVMNEIMANPQVGKVLPNSEYVELLNTSQKVISLCGWQLSDNSNTATLPNYLLLPDSLVLLIPTSSVNLFSNSKNILALKSFPSLSNDGDELYLNDSNGNIIHSVNYNKQMYQNAIKQLGGFSLELIDANKACIQNNNWTASISPLGGTPCEDNSVKGILKLIPKSSLTHIYPTTKKELQLYFTTNMAEPSISTQIEISPNILIEDQSTDTKNKQILHLVLKDSIVNNCKYSLKITNELNCLNQNIEPQIGDFGWPENPANPSIVINELLFHSKTNGVDFVEILNISDSIYDLKNIAIANQNFQDSLSEYHVVYPSGRLLFPNQFVVLTDSKEKTENQYNVLNGQLLIETTLPNFNNTEGSCLLLNTNTLNEIDRLNYNENMHFQLIEDKTGVSLERINYLKPSNDITNWTSASSRCGYATPTYQNSQFLNETNRHNQFAIYPEKISPDGDGYEDIMNFSYHLNSTNYIGNIDVYNDRGILIKKLLHAQLVGTDGSVNWDGIDDLGNKTPIGIYIAYFHFFDDKGNVISDKKSLVVAAKL